MVTSPLILLAISAFDTGDKLLDLAHENLLYVCFFVTKKAVQKEFRKFTL